MTHSLAETFPSWPVGHRLIVVDKVSILTFDEQLNIFNQCDYSPA